MANTYAFNIRSYQTVWSQDVLNTLGFMEGAAGFAIFNKGNSGKLVKIRQIDVFGNQPGSTFLGARANVSRISAHTAGSGRLATPIPMDSTYAAPAGVEIYSNPGEVTVTDTAVRSIWAAPLAMMASPLPGSLRQFPFSSEIYDRQGSGIGEAQPLTLNQNQGLALNVPGTSTPMAFGIGLRFRYGGNTFVATIECSVIAGYPMWSIMNTNSTPLYIERITMIEIGLAVYNRFAVEMIDIMDETTGEDQSVVPMDSTAPLPTTIKVRVGPRVVRAGAAQGALVALPLLRSPAWFHQAQDTAMPFNQTLEQATKYSMYGQGGDSETILRPGKGIAVYERMGANIGLPAFRGLFTVEDIPTGGGAAPVARSYIG
jgi:hypothetical protein